MSMRWFVALFDDAGDTLHDHLADYTKDGKVDGSDASAAIGNIVTLHYLANPTGPFAPNGGGGSAAPAAWPACCPEQKC